MDALGYDKTFTSTVGDTAAAVGNRIAAAVLAYGATDGSNEADDYADPTYAPVNEPLIVKLPGAIMNDPNRWQPLALEFMVTQNGIPLPANVGTFIGAGWGTVKPFAFVLADNYPAPQPQLGGVGAELFKQAFVDNIRKSRERLLSLVVPWRRTFLANVAWARIGSFSGAAASGSFPSDHSTARSCSISSRTSGMPVS